jgi:hypothetical protein
MNRRDPPEMEKIAMKYPLLILAFVMVTAALGFPSESGSEVPEDSLWNKAVALWSMNDDLVPGLMKMHMQEVDGDGRVKNQDKYHEVWSTLSLGEDGEVHYEVVKAIDDGEDVTQEEKAEQEKERDEEDEDSDSHRMEGYSPFDSRRQERISARPVGAGGMVAGRNTMEYEFSEQTKAGVEISGKAWLDAATGAPVKIEYTPDPLPKRVKRMVTTMEYRQPAPDSLIVKSMFVEVTGGILFIKKHFHMNMTFDEYWRKPEDFESDQEGE